MTRPSHDYRGTLYYESKDSVFGSENIVSDIKNSVFFILISAKTVFCRENRKNTVFGTLKPKALFLHLRPCFCYSKNRVKPVSEFSVRYF